MKKAIFLIALLFYGAISANNIKPSTDLKNGVISGVVLDQNTRQPVPYASIVIKSQTDLKTITGGISQDDGSFLIEGLPEGELLLEVQFIGYKAYSKIITITKDIKKLELGTIFLEEETGELSGVEVVGERTTIEQKIDRKVINVGKDLTTTGATAC